VSATTGIDQKRKCTLEGYQRSATPAGVGTFLGNDTGGIGRWYGLNHRLRLFDPCRIIKRRLSHTIDRKRGGIISLGPTILFRREKTVTKREMMG